MKINKIFVYGTLKRGFYNERFIPDEMIAKKWTAGVNADLYTVKNASFPALINLDSGNIVIGELYEIEHGYLNTVIEKCDYLEGHPVFYKRTIVDVIDENSEIHQAYTYVFLHKDKVGELIESGIFK